ncbi:hypothetical protein H8958_012757 [Nasalis larvatus]
MAELQQLRVQEVVDSMLKSLERENTGRCRVSCSDAAPAVVRTARPPCSRCTSASKHCHVPLAQAQALVTIKDSIDAGSKELQVKQQLDGCVTKCVDEHTHYIPTMTKKMKEALLSTGK